MVGISPRRVIIHHFLIFSIFVSAFLYTIRRISVVYVRAGGRSASQHSRQHLNLAWRRARSGAGQNFLKILLAIVRRRRLALPDNILSGTYWQLSGVKQKYFQITRLSGAAGIDAGVYLKNNLNTLVIVRHRRRWRRKAMDSRMTILWRFCRKWRKYQHGIQGDGFRFKKFLPSFIMIWKTRHFKIPLSCVICELQV